MCFRGTTIIIPAPHIQTHMSHKSFIWGCTYFYKNVSYFWSVFINNRLTRNTDLLYIICRKSGATAFKKCFQMCIYYIHCWYFLTSEEPQGPPSLPYTFKISQIPRYDALLPSSTICSGLVLSNIRLNHSPN